MCKSSTCQCGPDGERRGILQGQDGKIFSLAGAAGYPGKAFSASPTRNKLKLNGNLRDGFSRSGARNFSSSYRHGRAPLHSLFCPVLRKLCRAAVDTTCFRVHFPGPKPLLFPIRNPQSAIYLARCSSILSQISSTPCPGRSGAMASPFSMRRGWVMYFSRPNPWPSR